MQIKDPKFPVRGGKLKKVIWWLCPCGFTSDKQEYIEVKLSGTVADD